MTWISAPQAGIQRDGIPFLYPQKWGYQIDRPLERIGAHTRGFNKESIGICYEGGLDCKGHPKDTRTEWQKHSMRVLILTLLKDYPAAASADIATSVPT